MSHKCINRALDYQNLTGMMTYQYTASEYWRFTAVNTRTKPSNCNIGMLYRDMTMATSIITEQVLTDLMRVNFNSEKGHSLPASKQTDTRLNAGQTIDIAGSQYSIRNKTDNYIAFKQEVVQ